MDRPIVVVPLFLMLNIHLAAGYYYLDKDITIGLINLFMAIYLLGCML